MTRVLLIALLTLTLAACLDMPTAQPPTATLSPAPLDAPTATATATATATPTACTVTAIALHIRQGAGVEYAVIGWLTRGETVTVLRSSGGWYETPDGWINSNFCEVTK